MFRATRNTIHAMNALPKTMFESRYNVSQRSVITRILNELISLSIYIRIQEIFTASRQLITFRCTATAENAFRIHNKLFEISRRLTSTSFLRIFRFHENPRSNRLQAINLSFPVNSQVADNIKITQRSNIEFIAAKTFGQRIDFAFATEHSLTINLDRASATNCTTASSDESQSRVNSIFNFLKAPENRTVRFIIEGIGLYIGATFVVAVDMIRNLSHLSTSFLSVRSELRQRRADLLRIHHLL